MAVCGAIIGGEDAPRPPHAGRPAPLLDRRRARLGAGLDGLPGDAASDGAGRASRRYAWAWADVVLFTALVLLNDGLKTSQVAGYFLLVSASGLWFRERLVWFTTVMAVSAYGALVLVETWKLQDLPETPYRHVVFAAVLAVSGLIIAYQVKRVRSLSHYYEHRPSP